VEGQHLTQAAGDIFLGWAAGVDGIDYYFRQLWDMKGGLETESLSERGGAGLADYGRLCGWALARSHARTGDPVAIGAYLGRGDRFDRAVGEFALGYADQTERDHAALLRAIAAGTVTARPGV
jgi:hypothetical protein